MPTKKNERTLSENIGSGAKYVGSASALALAITSILVFYQPDLKPIADSMTAILVFVINLVLIYVFKEALK